MWPLVCRMPGQANPQEENTRVTLLNANVWTRLVVILSVAGRGALESLEYAFQIVLKDVKLLNLANKINEPMKMLTFLHKKSNSGHNQWCSFVMKYKRCP